MMFRKRDPRPYVRYEARYNQDSCSVEATLDVEAKAPQALMMVASLAATIIAQESEVIHAYLCRTLAENVVHALEQSKAQKRAKQEPAP